MEILKKIGRTLSDPKNLTLIGVSAVTGYFIGAYIYDKCKERKTNCAGDPADEEPRVGRGGRRRVTDAGKVKLAADPSKPKIALLERGDVETVTDYTSYANHRTVQDPDVKKALDERYADALDGDRVEEEPEVRKDEDEEDAEEIESAEEEAVEEGEDLSENIDWPANKRFANEYWRKEYGMVMTPNMAMLMDLLWDDEEEHLIATCLTGIPEREEFVPEYMKVSAERYRLVDLFDWKHGGKGRDEIHLRYWPVDDELFFDDHEIPERCTNIDLYNKVTGIWERRGWGTIYLMDQWNEDVKYVITVEGLEGSEYGPEKYGFRNGWVLWWAERVHDKLEAFTTEDGRRGWIAMRGYEYDHGDLSVDEIMDGMVNRE